MRDAVNFQGCEMETQQYRCTKINKSPTVKPIFNWAKVCSRTYLEVFGKPSWFLFGQTFLRKPSWEYSSKYIRGPKSFAQHVLGTFALFDEHYL